MPGGRLTIEDRRLIATWLGDGLGYAEIARRLGRPTSTISREVARNTGRSGYRAEEAARVTGERARRRKPGAAPAVQAAPDEYGRDPDAMQDFLEQFTDMMVHTGLPRTMSRVLACLYSTDTGVLTSAELVQRLHVSPASISNAVGYLEKLELLKRERDGRRERYVVDDDILQRAWYANVRSNAELIDITQKAVEVLGVATPAGARMDEVRRFYTHIHELMLGQEVPAITGDTLTLLAALLHAARPLTISALATALDWAEARVTEAVRVAVEHPEVTGPVALVSEGETYRALPKVARLTAAQLAALGTGPQ